MASIDVIKNEQGYHVGKTGGAPGFIFHLYNTTQTAAEARRLAEDHSQRSGLPIKIVSDVARQDLYPEEEE